MEMNSTPRRFLALGRVILFDIQQVDSTARVRVVHSISVLLFLASALAGVLGTVTYIGDICDKPWGPRLFYFSVASHPFFFFIYLFFFIFLYHFPLYIILISIAWCDTIIRIIYSYCNFFSFSHITILLINVKKNNS